jgi:hypothetical protein
VQGRSRELLQEHLPGMAKTLWNSEDEVTTLRHLLKEIADDPLRSDQVRQLTQIKWLLLTVVVIALWHVMR